MCGYVWIAQILYTLTRVSVWTLRLRSVHGNLSVLKLWHTHATPCAAHRISYGKQPPWSLRRRGRSIGRVSDSRSKGPRFESRQKHKEYLWFFSESKMLCWLALGVPNLRVHTHTHKNDHVRTHVKDPVVHITVRWITETRKEPAGTKTWQNNQPVDCCHEKIYVKRR